jgi:hypothetical protein
MVGKFKYILERLSTVSRTSVKNFELISTCFMIEMKNISP